MARVSISRREGPGFQPLRTGSIRAQVLETLRASIFSGQLSPGDALREAHLARDFGVSQATVREALIELEHRGLVVRKPNKETVVTRLSQEEIAERAQLRAALEGMAGVQAAPRLTGDDFQLLERKLRDMDAARAAEDYFGFSAADLNFHRAVWEMSGNKTLYRTLEYLTIPLFAFLSIQRSRRFHNISPAVRPHQPIVDALRSRDEAAIKAAFEEHIMGSYRQLA
ncbi:MAG: GntR family transcriptional regulator [Bryobacteraceae bacterium]